MRHPSLLILLVSIVVGFGESTPVPTTGKWLSDGSPGIQSTGPEVRSESDEPGSVVYNALWEEGDGVSSGEHYWKVTVEEGEGPLSLGITDKSRFKQGWETRALLFNRGLTNGGASLTNDQFGPQLKPGDIFGIFLTFEKDNLKLYFDINGRSLGLAFDQPKTIFSGPLFPLAQFPGKGKVRIEKVDGKPTSLVRVDPSYTGVEGDWKLVVEEFKVQGQVKPVPQQVTLKLTKLESEDEKYQGSIHVDNRIGFTLSVSDLRTSNIFSTEIGVTKDVAEVENNMVKLLENLSKVELDNKQDGKELLVLKSGENIETKWERYTISVEPFTSNPFAQF